MRRKLTRPDDANIFRRLEVPALLGPAKEN